MSEEKLFEAQDLGIKVTPERVVLSSATYVVANITSVRAEEDWSVAYGGGVAIVVGFLLLALGGIGYALGALGVLGGGIAVALGRVTEVVITTGASERVAFRSTKKSLALDLASAINLAIMKRTASHR